MNRKTLAALLLLGFLGQQSCQEKLIPASEEEDEVVTPYQDLTESEKRLPENAVAGLEVAKGLKVQLFASEPVIGNPTNIDIDAKGRVWMCEAYNYRPALNPENLQREEGDRILILEDSNGDGKADITKVFYQGTDINAPLGIAVLGNKVIVSCSPNVYLLTDTDGDDKADKKEILYTGLGGEQHDHAIHSFTFGPDGKLYFNFGNEGKRIVDRDGKPIIDKVGNEVNNSGKPYRQGMVFRVNPDGTEFEVLAHNFRNNYEVAVDSYGTLWQSDNDDDGNQGVRINYVMEFGNYGYTNEMTGAGWQSRRTNMEKETPQRHWHQNDPGSIPNLLFTRAGSPTGMVVYEGTLLPEVYRNQMIHADAGPNVVRAYPVTNDGAGYKAEMVPLLKGTRDQWFRPSDVCVAPDGSLFVADWYDPGVGGHQMGDMSKGRIFRVAPPAKPYRVPKLDLSSPKGAVLALQSPNLATRYLAWEKLNTWGPKAEPALQKLWASENPRHRARALWLLAKIEGNSQKYIQEALRDEDENIRITGLRIARQEETDIIPYVRQLANDSSPQVRREAAIALRYSKSEEAPALWTTLAQQYDGKDRWYLEALGIGADKQWDAYLAAWQEKVKNQPQTKANSDIVWRSRTELALPLLAQHITDPEVLPADKLRYFRAFDFIEAPGKEAVLLGLLDYNGPYQEEIAGTALYHISPSSLAKSPRLKTSLDKTLASLQGTREFVDLVERYQLRNHNKTLLQMALANPEKNLGAASMRLLLNMGGTDLLKAAIQSKDKATASAAFKALSGVGSSESMDLLQSVVMDKSGNLEMRKEAVKALGSGWGGSERLMLVVKDGKMPEELESTAAIAMASSMRKEVQAEGLKYLNSGNTAEGKPLPSINELIKKEGTALAGQKVFQKSCIACHKSGEQGVDFGPALTQIGDKLAKSALYMAIMQPDAGISFGYEGYVVKMKDGNQMAGIISSETDEVIELKALGGTPTKLYKFNVASIDQMPTSMMPALQQTMTEQELVDLVEYLASLKAAN